MSSVEGDRLLGTASVAPSRPPSAQLADQLPRVLAQDHFVRSYVGLCDEIWASVLERLDHLEWYLDVGVAPLPFVRWLGGWLGITVDANLPEARQRELVRTAGRTLLWRGTRHGLEQVLAALTGGAVDVRDGGGVFTEEHPPATAQQVTIRLTSSGGLTEQHLTELVRGEVPANAVVDLEVDAAPAPQPADADDEAVLAEPQPHGDEGFLPPMRGRLDNDADDDEPPPA